MLCIYISKPEMKNTHQTCMTENWRNKKKKSSDISHEINRCNKPFFFLGLEHSYAFHSQWYTRTLFPVCKYPFSCASIYKSKHIPSLIIGPQTHLLWPTFTIFTRNYLSVCLAFHACVLLLLWCCVVAARYSSLVPTIAFFVAYAL